MPQGASGLSRTGALESGLGRTLLAVASIALAWYFVDAARDGQAFRLQQLEARFERAGRYAAERLPARALVVTSSHSGSVRFYGGRRTLVWDGLPPTALDTALRFVRERGFEPYLMLEPGEEPIFRRRFQGRDVARLDWPPVAEISGRVRVYRPDDRARYVAGEAAATEYIR